MIKLTNIDDDSKMLVGQDMIKSAIETVDGTAINIFGMGGHFIVKESLEQIEHMMLRDQFAMSVISGLLANNSIDDIGAKGISHDAYLFADAMLEERGK